MKPAAHPAIFPLSAKLRNQLMYFIFFAVCVVNGRYIAAHRAWLMALMLAVVAISGLLLWDNHYLRQGRSN